MNEELQVVREDRCSEIRAASSQSVTDSGCLFFCRAKMLDEATYLGRDEALGPDEELSLSWISWQDCLEHSAQA